MDSVQAGDGVCVVRYERLLPMRLEGLWSYFTDPERINLWFPLRVAAVDPQLGGAVDVIDAEGVKSRGVFIAYDVPQMLAFTVDGAQFRFETHPEPVGTLLVFRYIKPDDAPDLDWPAALTALEAAVS